MLIFGYLYNQYLLGWFNANFVDLTPCKDILSRGWVFVLQTNRIHRSCEMHCVVIAFYKSEVPKTIDNYLIDHFSTLNTQPILKTYLLGPDREPFHSLGVKISPIVAFFCLPVGIPWLSPIAHPIRRDWVLKFEKACCTYFQAWPQSFKFTISPTMTI